MTPRDELVERLRTTLNRFSVDDATIVVVTDAVQTWIRERMPEQVRPLSEDDGWYRRGQADMLALVRERLGL